MGWLPEKGEVVLGKYRIVRQLGRGGMGVVVEAVNIGTDGHVALKLLTPTTEDDSDRRARMGREARAAAKLRSRFVGRVFDFDYTKEGSPVMVMELLEGHDLSVEMRRTTVLRIEDAVSYLIQACAGVAEAHSLGVIHRDIKPGNLFLDMSNPTSPMLRVLDFGLSKIVDSDTVSDLTSPHDALGTPSYMSPEQAQATKDVTARTDVWALGVVLYRALTGSLPIDGRGIDFARTLLDKRPLPRVEREGVPAELAGVVARALEKVAAKRYPDARALGHALIPFVAAPSPTTKLAIDELATVPSVRDPNPPPVVTAEKDESTTRTAMVTADTADTAESADTIATIPRRQAPARPPASGRSHAPVPHSSRRASAPPVVRFVRALSRETHYLVGGTVVFALATILLAVLVSPGASAPRQEPRIVATPSRPAAATAATATTPAFVFPEPSPARAAPVPPAASTSAAPAPRPAPRPRTSPAPPRTLRDENDNPARL